jgi:hypothetical protein
LLSYKLNEKGNNLLVKIKTRKRKRAEHYYWPLLKLRNSWRKDEALFYFSQVLFSLFFNKQRPQLGAVGLLILLKKRIDSV